MDKLVDLLGNLIRCIFIGSVGLIIVCLLGVVLLQLWHPDLSGSWIECDALVEVHAEQAIDPFPVDDLKLLGTYSLGVNLDKIQSIAFSRDLESVAVARPRVMEVWDVQSGTLSTQIDIEVEEIPSLAWSPNNKYLALGLSDYQSPDPSGTAPISPWDNHVAIWNIKTNQEILVVDGSPGSIDNFDFIGPIYFSPDSKLLIAQSGDGFYVWDIEHGQEQCHFDLNSIFWDTHTEEMLLSIGWQADKPPLITGQEIGRGIPTNSTDVWSVAHGKALLRIDTDKDRFVGAHLSANSSLIALISSGAAYGVSPDRITIWTVPTGKLLMSLDENYKFLDWSPDEQKILVGNDTSLEVWDVLTAHRLAQVQLEESEIVDGRWSRDGATSAILLKDGTVQFWSVH